LSNNAKGEIAMKKLAVLLSLALFLVLLPSCTSPQVEALKYEIDELESEIAELENLYWDYYSIIDERDTAEFLLGEVQSELEEANGKIYRLEEELSWYEDNCYCSILEECDFCGAHGTDFALCWIGNDQYCAECLYDKFLDD
jgi:hypothetical protein